MDVMEQYILVKTEYKHIQINLSGFFPAILKVMFLIFACFFTTYAFIYNY